MTTPRGRDDARLWAIVAATVRPLAGRARPVLPPEPKPTRPAPVGGQGAKPTERPNAAPFRAIRPLPTVRGPQTIEPNRRRRLDLGREPMAASLDLHGMSREAAHARLVAFVQSLAAGNARALLVITGKGVGGQGVLKRHVPEWLAEPPLRDLVAGISEAHPKRGGAGALYVVLRRGRG